MKPWLIPVLVTALLYYPRARRNTMDVLELMLSGDLGSLYIIAGEHGVEVPDLVAEERWSKWTGEFFSNGE